MTSRDLRPKGQLRSAYGRHGQCILPDQVLRRIAASKESVVDTVRPDGTTLRSKVLDSLDLNTSFRLARVGAAESQRAFRQMRRELRQARRGFLAGAVTGDCTKDRTMYDAQNTFRVPGNEVRSEGQSATGDIAVTEAYDSFGKTLDFYCQAYGRNSIDDQGMPIEATVHYSRDYDNAFWDGSGMRFGDGDQQMFNRFTIDIDIIGHELSHGVTEHEANLVYSRQPGALNESFSDVMGSLVKQFALDQTADAADWLIGANLFMPGAVKPDPGFPGPALRSMKDPGHAYNDPVLGKDPQPAHMSDYVDTFSDSGGVHINSGIPNHAFYLAAVELGGHAWERAGLIWYETMATWLPSTAQFAGFARLSVMIAGWLFGSHSREQQAVQGAWSQVGVLR